MRAGNFGIGVRVIVARAAGVVSAIIGFHGAPDRTEPDHSTLTTNGATAFAPANAVDTWPWG